LKWKNRPESSFYPIQIEAPGAVAGGAEIPPSFATDRAEVYPGNQRGLFQRRTSDEDKEGMKKMSGKNRLARSLIVKTPMFLNFWPNFDPDHQL
jgi:hypothetical protein